MDFQLASDLHIDTHGGLRAPASCYPVRASPILVLCGDVFPFSRAEYPEIMRRVAEPFDMVLYVPGNHEYYEVPLNSDTAIEDACFSLGNVVFMNKRSITLHNTQFIGATLWTDNPINSGTTLMNDYTYIGGMTPRKSYELHKEHRKFIIDSVGQAQRDGRACAVIMTHHAPDLRLSLGCSSRAEESFPFYFANDMQAVTRNPFVKAWCHGHTHESYRTKLDNDGPVFLTNACGYPDEDTGYLRSAVFKLW
jgi:hypothetical protein